ncbi:MAG: VPS10 domain-containing protein [Candidatus Kapaibacterium sp.]
MRLLCTLGLLIASTVVMTAQYWRETTGPAAPTVALASNSKGWVFAGTEYSKIYRTTDKGQTWEPFDQGIDDGIHFFTVSQIRVADNDVLYAAVNGLGLLRSDDDGVTWRKLDINIPDIVTNARVFFDLKKMPDGKLRILLGYDGGTKALLLRRSDDGGETFTEVPKSNLPSAISSIFGAYMSPNSEKFFVLVSYNKGLYRSSNYGTSWTRIDSDPSSGESDDAFKTMAYDDKGHLYVGRNALSASTKSQNAVVMKSTNDGESWSYLTNGWDNRDITNNRVSSIAVGKNGLMMVTLEKVSGPFRSTDYGATWTVVRDGFRSPDGASKAVIITKDGEEYVAPNGEFVMRHGSSTGVDELPSSVRMDVYPNPANDRVRIDVAPFHVGAVEVNLRDAAGRLVIPQHQTTSSKESEITIWLSTVDLPVGMYMATVRSAAGVTTVPVAVSR